jgi:hypothetical protein
MSYGGMEDDGDGERYRTSQTPPDYSYGHRRLDEQKRPDRLDWDDGGSPLRFRQPDIGDSDDDTVPYNAYNGLPASNGILPPGGDDDSQMTQSPPPAPDSNRTAIALVGLPSVIARHALSIVLPGPRGHAAFKHMGSRCGDLFDRDAPAGEAPFLTAAAAGEAAFMAKLLGESHAERLVRSDMLKIDVEQALLEFDDFIASRAHLVRSICAMRELSVADQSRILRDIQVYAVRFYDLVVPLAVAYDEVVPLCDCSDIVRCIVPTRFRTDSPDELDTFEYVALPHGPASSVFEIMPSAIIVRFVSATGDGINLSTTKQKFLDQFRVLTLMETRCVRRCATRNEPADNEEIQRVCTGITAHQTRVASAITNMHIAFDLAIKMELRARESIFAFSPVGISSAIQFARHTIVPLLSSSQGAAAALSSSGRSDRVSVAELKGVISSSNSQFLVEMIQEEYDKELKAGGFS